MTEKGKPPRGTARTGRTIQRRRGRGRGRGKRGHEGRDPKWEGKRQPNSADVDVHFTRVVSFHLIPWKIFSQPRRTLREDAFPHLLASVHVSLSETTSQSHERVPHHCLLLRTRWRAGYVHACTRFPSRCMTRPQSFVHPHPALRRYPFAASAETCRGVQLASFLVLIHLIGGQMITNIACRFWPQRVFLL
ncbi:hypothetical protein BHM03_00024704 [Ensete ventricosum]|nr:hypothetical protein BHM03_00024704 [Ensete ventricosum]